MRLGQARPAATRRPRVRSGARASHTVCSAPTMTRPAGSPADRRSATARGRSRLRGRGAGRAAARQPDHDRGCQHRDRHPAQQPPHRAGGRTRDGGAARTRMRCWVGHTRGSASSRRAGRSPCAGRTDTGTTAAATAAGRGRARGRGPRSPPGARLPTPDRRRLARRPLGPARRWLTARAAAAGIRQSTRPRRTGRLPGLRPGALVLVHRAASTSATSAIPNRRSNKHLCDVYHRAPTESGNARRVVRTCVWRAGLIRATVVPTASPAMAIPTARDDADAARPVRPTSRHSEEG